MAIKSVPKTPPPAEKAPEKGAEAPAPKKGGKLLLIATAALALAGGGGGAAWFLYFKDAGSPAGARIEAPKPPVFVNLEPFTVNLQPEGGADQYLQTVAVLKIADTATADILKQYMPEVRHRILLLLSGKHASELATPQGREALAEQLRREVNRIIATASGQAATPAPKPAAGQPEPAPAAAPHPDDPVQGVLFTSFIVQ